VRLEFFPAASFPPCQKFPEENLPLCVRKGSESEKIFKKTARKAKNTLKHRSGIVYNRGIDQRLLDSERETAQGGRCLSMKVIKTKKQKGSLLLRIAVLALAVYVTTALVNQQMQISEKRRQLAQLKQEIRIQEIKNDDLKHALNSGENASPDYIERVAREGLDYAKPGERVFVNIAGN
jgi:cell division protein DivIC